MSAPSPYDVPEEYPRPSAGAIGDDDGTPAAAPDSVHGTRAPKQPAAPVKASNRKRPSRAHWYISAAIVAVCTYLVIEPTLKGSESTPVVSPPAAVVEEPVTLEALPTGTCPAGTDDAPLLDVTGVPAGSRVDITLYHDPTGKGKGSPAGTQPFILVDGDGCYYVSWVLQSEPGTYTFTYEVVSSPQ